MGVGAALSGALTLAARTFRKRGWFVFASATMFVGFGVFAYLCLLWRPDTREVFVPPGFEEVFQHWKSGNMEARDATTSLAATLMYSGNNPFVSIMAGAISVATFGLGTVYSLFSNGGILGALVFEVAPVGRVGYLFTHIMPHGVTELGGIVVSGAGGLCLGWSLVNPGRRRRSEALREAGKDAIVLLGISIVMMFIAAPIEGFFSFNPLVPGFLKVAFAGFSFVAWALFFGGFGREASGEVASTKSASRLSRDIR
jgi:uncharacterized membrane protein SpoIIM required for sporulation